MHIRLNSTRKLGKGFAVPGIESPYFWPGAYLHAIDTTGDARWRFRDLTIIHIVRRYLAFLANEIYLGERNL
jgi:hypothetical protein